MIIPCPFRSLSDEGREKIMAIFERKRSAENQALMELLREEKRVCRLCLNLMERLKGDLNCVEGLSSSFAAVVEAEGKHP